MFDKLYSQFVFSYTFSLYHGLSSFVISLLYDLIHFGAVFIVNVNNAFLLARKNIFFVAQ